MVHLTKRARISSNRSKDRSTLNAEKTGEVVKKSLRSSVLHSSSEILPMKRFGDSSAVKSVGIVGLLNMVVALLVISFLKSTGGFNVNVTAPCAPEQSIFLVLVLVTFIFAMFYIAVAIRNMNDILGVRMELLAVAFSMFFSFSSYQISSAKTIAPYFKPIGGPSFFVFVFGTIVPHTIMVFWPLYLIRKERKSKTTKEISFLDVLQDLDKFNELRNLAARELSVENVLFLEDYCRFFSKFNMPVYLDNAFRVPEEAINISHLRYSEEATIPEQKAVDDYVKRMYNKFIAVGSPLELNISSENRSRIHEAISKNKIDLMLLDTVKIEVLKMIQSNTFARYQRKLREIHV
jgi:hypothetical protein